MITLPTSPGPMASDMRIIHSGAVVDSALGGASQIVNRPGSRCALQVSLPPMLPADARRWFASLSAALQEGARFTLRQVGFAVGTPGAPVVNGAGQVGQSLVISGAAANYAFKAGQLVTITTATRKYLYPLAADVTASGLGAATLLLSMPLRVSPANGDAVEVAAPVIEGSISVDNPHLPFNAARLAEGIGFTISELR